MNSSCNCTTLILLFTIVAFSPIAIAHQPIFAIDGIHSRDQPFEIEQPEVSKAIYSELTGEPHFYRITSNKRFNFYAGLTKPKLDNCPVGYTFSLDVLAENFNIITNVDGGNFEWWPWYESFGRKWYWVGPEVGANFRHTRALAAGTYYIRVYNLLNRGHYVLAVGDIESFPVGVMTRMLRDLPKINRKFWKEAKCSS